MYDSDEKENKKALKIHKNAILRNRNVGSQESLCFNEQFSFHLISSWIYFKHLYLQNARLIILFHWNELSVVFLNNGIKVRKQYIYDFFWKSKLWQNFYDYFAENIISLWIPATSVEYLTCWNGTRSSFSLNFNESYYWKKVRDSSLWMCHVHVHKPISISLHITSVQCIITTYKQIQRKISLFLNL